MFDRQEYDKKYYLDNRAKKIKQATDYYKANTKECIEARMARYYKNIAKEKAYRRAYYLKYGK